MWQWRDGVPGGNREECAGTRATHPGWHHGRRHYPPARTPFHFQVKEVSAPVTSKVSAAAGAVAEKAKPVTEPIGSVWDEC